MEQGAREVMGMDMQPSSYLRTWRKSTLFDVGGIMSDPKMPEFQKKIGIWAYGESIPYPTMDAFTIVENGCMTFSVAVGTAEVLFSIWLMVGEVRIGIKIPGSLVSTDVAREKIAKACDGKACQRQERIGDGIFFDWIWRDEGWAKFDFMLSTITRPVEAAVLADHIASMVTHLYLSVTHHLIVGNNLTVVLRRIARAGTTPWMIRERGDDGAFMSHAIAMGWTITNTEPGFDGGRDHIALLPVGVKPTLGQLRTQDGASCYVTFTEQCQSVPSSGQVKAIAS